MRFIKFCRCFPAAIMIIFYGGLAIIGSPNLALAAQLDNLGKQHKMANDPAAAAEEVELNPINDYLRSAKTLTLPLTEAIELDRAASAAAYHIQPPAQENALWSVRYSLPDNTAAAVSLSLVTVNFDEHQRVISFDTLMVRNGLGEVTVDALLWPDKPVYVLVSANPPSQAELVIQEIEQKWSMLETQGAHSENIALLSNTPVVKKLDFVWSTANAAADQPLWDLKLVSEPGTSYSLQLRSGNQRANATGAKNEPIIFSGMAPPESELRLSIKPKGKQFSRVAVILEQQTSARVDHERELDSPQSVSFGKFFTGTISHFSGTGAQRPETDTWIIDLPISSQEAKPAPMQIQVVANDPANTVKLSLNQSGRSTPLVTKVANGELNSGPLILEAGKYTLGISSSDVGTAYRLKVDWTSQLNANSEKEPNNTVQDANQIVSRKVVKGELSGASDEDFFRLDTSADGAAQYWRLIATGGGVKRITLGKTYWIEAHKADSNPTLSMDYMLLLPGVHQIKLTGAGPYSLRAIPLGAPKPGFEIEPNDGKLGPSGRLIIGQLAKGSLDKAMVAGHSDIDHYRFVVNKRGKYRITVTAPPDEAIRTNLSLNGSPWFSSAQTTPAGSVIQYASELLAGEYVLELTNLKGRRALDEYSLLVEQLSEATDVGNEPNDIVGLGTLIEKTGTRVATLGPFDQKDCYALAPTTTSSSVELTATEKLPLRFFDRYSIPMQKLATRDPVNRTLWSLAPHEETLFFCVSGDGHITAPTAYTLNTNLGATTPEPQPQLSSPQLPKAMEGGLNVAWYGLGARWEPAHGSTPAKNADSVIKKLNRVINNISPFGAGVEWDAARDSAAAYRLNLAGDDAIPLVGVVLNTRTDRYSERKTRRFRVLASQDGVSFSQVMLGELSYSNNDQYLLFEKPVTAKYLQFLPLDGFQSRSPHYARFQEFKVIAGADYSPAKIGVDLASTSVGGHLVSHDFKPANKNNADQLDAVILDPQNAAAKVRQCKFPKNQSEAAWVVGFHHNRAARVTQLSYAPDITEGSAPQFASLKVRVSTESPLGPWREVASWSAEQLGAPLSVPMPESPWIRFVKFEATGTQDTAYRCPHDIAIREAVASNDYRSILGEWSEYGTSGPFEAVQPSAEADYSPKGGADSDHANRIERGEIVASSVKRERNDDWFAYRSAAAGGNANSLLLSVAHPTSFKPYVNIRDGQGESVQTLVEQPTEVTGGASEPVSENGFGVLPQGWTSTNYIAWAPSDTDFSIHIQEPPRNVVLTWDSSGSMGPQLPYIEMASRRWADYLKPDHEFAKIMKFAQKSFPENEWANLPHMLQAALHSNSQKSGGSSDAENSLLDANELLAPRYGNHAIVVTTDGEFPRSKEFWDYQKQHCSTVYAAGLAAAAVGEDFILQSVYQDNFQNWVSACGGHYRYCDNVTCLEDFYEFAAMDIRKAKPYKLKIDEGFRAPPKPGLLSVIAGEKSAEVTAKALYVILDASGSMLQRLDGKRRIEIAKDTLKKVVKESVGKQNHFGMRTFGLEVDECRHALTLPVAKHTAAAVDAAIDRVIAVNKAKTPIAASLEAAASDLSSFSGEKVIVLLTDGEETCDGDSEAILTSLRARDIDVKMHIVGFALDDEMLVGEFKNWATIGGGQYYEAGNQSALQTALHNAVTPRFEVRNSVGDIVATGYLGDAQQSLPPGNYLVALPDYPELNAISVTLAADSEQVVEFE